MSLLNDYEGLCNAQDVSIFKDVLDETLKPILIILDERYFKTNQQLGELNDKIKELQNTVECHLKDLETRVEHELADAYDTHNTKLHNIWADVLKLQSDVESIKQSLKK